MYRGVSNAKKLRVGQEKFNLGYRAKHPVILIPGFASSGLDVWQSPEKSWYRERLWVSLGKLSQKFLSENIKSTVSSLSGWVQAAKSLMGTSMPPPEPEDQSQTQKNSETERVNTKNQAHQFRKHGSNT